MAIRQNFTKNRDFMTITQAEINRLVNERTNRLRNSLSIKVLKQLLFERNLLVVLVSLGHEQLFKDNNWHLDWRK